MAKELSSSKMSFKVSPTLRKRIEDFSEKIGVNYSAVIKMAIVEYINRMERLMEIQEQSASNALEAIKKIDEE